MAKMPLSHRTCLSAFVLAFIALAGCTNPHSDLKLAPTAHTSPQLSAEDRLWISSTVGAYERCAGVYDAGALVQAATGNPGAAQNLRDLGNGAEVTSWTLAIYFLGSPKDNAVAGAADRRKSQGAYLMGMLKAGNQAGFLEVFNQCQSVYGDTQTAV